MPDSRENCAAVIGLGYVGLPLATAFAEAGFRVIGVDVSESKVERVNAGKSVTPDVPDYIVGGLVKEERLRATTDFSAIAEAGLVSICVPTPLRKSKDPDISYIVDSCNALAPHVAPGTVVVLESTTYPGTTREIILPTFEERGFTAGRDFYLAFSPERIDPGNKTWTVKNTPKVVGGITASCTEKAAALYGRALESVVPVSSAETAEMSKLLENTFRSINIGLVNELAMVCHRLGISSFEVIDAAATKPFGYMPFRPGPGLGGHCIPIDPLYLSWKMRTLDYKVRFIDLADEVNSSMPDYVIHRVADILNDREKAVKGSRILILGLAYKRDIDDVRESPAVDLLEGLQARGARVEYHDPFVESYRLSNGEISGLSAATAASEDFDLLLVATDHGRIDWASLADRRIPILDTRNVYKDRDETHIFQL